MQYAPICLVDLQGSVGTSIGWGPWMGAGMAAADGGLIRRLQRQGLAGIRPEQGLLVLSAALHAAAEAQASWPTATLAGPVIWQNLLKAPSRRQPLYDEFQVRHCSLLLHIAASNKLDVVASSSCTSPKSWQTLQRHQKVLPDAF